MQARLFWKLGLTYAALLLVVLLVVDLYSVRVVRAQAIRSANDALGSLLKLASRILPLPLTIRLWETGPRA